LTSTAPASSRAHRVIFIDLARALAVVFMLYGHAVDALLAVDYRAGTLYDVWQFQRGLTSCLFLLLSGFAFSIATARHWAAQVLISAGLVKRVRRFALFILLGYALHVPVYHLRELATATEPQWRTFLSVDVLQLIGATFLGVQLLVMMTRRPAVFMRVTLALAFVIALATPLLWSVEWTRWLPLGLAAYLSPAIGSQFPLTPWAAFVLVGAGLGQIYARWGAAHLAAYANRVLLLPAAALVGLSAVVPVIPGVTTGAAGFIPAQVLLRTGACLLILGAIAHVSRLMTRLPHVFGAVAQESLLIYFMHLCLVYGSIWNVGLAQIYGMTRTPRQMLVIVVLLVAAMTGLAWYWNWWKHTRPRAARWTSVAAGAVLLYKLL
jgi:uncharacterized membrane protein